MSQAVDVPSVDDSISSEREAEVVEAVQWLVDRYGYDKTEAQLLYALAILRRLRAESGGGE